MKTDCHIILIIIPILYDGYGSVTFQAISSMVHAGERNRRGVQRLEKGRRRLAHCSLSPRQLNRGQRANIFPYAVSVKHASRYSLCYSNLDFEKQKTSKFSEKVAIISSKSFSSFLKKVSVFLIHTHSIIAL